MPVLLDATSDPGIEPCAGRSITEYAEKLTTRCPLVDGSANQQVVLDEHRFITFDQDSESPRLGLARAGRKRGAQDGHEGHGRPLLPAWAVDAVIEHWPERCRCGHVFAVDEWVAVGTPARQRRRCSNAQVLGTEALAAPSLPIMARMNAEAGLRGLARRVAFRAF